MKDENNRSAYRPFVSELDKGLWTLVVTTSSKIMEQAQLGKYAASVYFGMAEECRGVGEDSRELMLASTFESRCRRR